MKVQGGELEMEKKKINIWNQLTMAEIKGQPLCNIAPTSWPGRYEGSLY